MQGLLFKELPDLLKGLALKKWARKIGFWSDRGDNPFKRKLLAGVDKLIHMVAGGKPRQLMLDLVARPNYKDVVAPVRNDDEENLLNNLKVVYHRMENKNCEGDAFQFSILQFLVGVRGLKAVHADGWRIGDEVWARVQETCQTRRKLIVTAGAL